MIYCIMGPTASGKSALAVQLAEQVNGEIISADSMQCYKGIPIGTAQPSETDLRKIPHHLVGFADYSERIDVFRFTELAEKAIKDVKSRGRIPVIAGGTGFYIKSLLYGLDDMPGDDRLRAELNAEFDRDDAMDDLRAKMRELDPAAAAKWHDCRRKLIRAMEVRLITGRSILDLQTGKRTLKYNARSVVLNREPEVLRQRIKARTHLMLEQGWVDEARAAVANGLLEGPTSHQALGYPVIAEFLQGRIDYGTMQERIMIATCQLARRQRTWFRHQHPEAIQLNDAGLDEAVKHDVSAIFNR